MLWITCTTQEYPTAGGEYRGRAALWDSGLPSSLREMSSSPDGSIMVRADKSMWQLRKITLNETPLSSVLWLQVDQMCTGWLGYLTLRVSSPPWGRRSPERIKAGHWIASHYIMTSPRWPRKTCRPHPLRVSLNNAPHCPNIYVPKIYLLI